MVLQGEPETSASQGALLQCPETPPTVGSRRGLPAAGRPQAGHAEVQQPCPHRMHRLKFIWSLQVNLGMLSILSMNEG